MAGLSENSPKEEEPFIVRFFDPNMEETDFRGRTLQDILNFQDRKLEMSHDYIQILFPLPEGSPFNWQAPVINRATFDAFRSRSELRNTFHQGFCRIMAFYGFDVDGIEEPKLSRSEHYLEAFRNWVCRMDHNHLRITRIIRSLRVLGMEKHAEAFHDAILEVNKDFPNYIGARSLMYWKRAAKRPLYLAPHEDDEDEVMGPRFLVEFEKAKAAAAAESKAAEEGVEAETSGKDKIVRDEITETKTESAEVESEKEIVEPKTTQKTAAAANDVAEIKVAGDGLGESSTELPESETAATEKVATVIKEDK